MRLKASIPSEEELVFGDELSIELMFFDGKVVLHIVEITARLSAATFIDSFWETYGQSVEGVWTAFVTIWCTIYTGYPNRVRTDKGSTLTSPQWKKPTDLSGIQFRIPGVKAHRSLVIGDRYHEPLRRTYKRVRNDHPSTPPRFLLRVSLKAMNDTIG